MPALPPPSQDPAAQSPFLARTLSLSACFPTALTLPGCPETKQHLMIDLDSTWQGGTAAASRYNPSCWDHLAFSRARRETFPLCQGPAYVWLPGPGRSQPSTPTSSQQCVLGYRQSPAFSSMLSTFGSLLSTDMRENVVPGQHCRQSLEVQKSACMFTLNNIIR